MSLPFLPGQASWCVTPPATAFGTALTTLIPPAPSPKEGPPLLYGLTGNQKPNWWGQPFTHITKALCQCGSTQNIQYFLRPLNWSTVRTAIAKNATAMVLMDDPGVFSTNYRYPCAAIPNFTPPGTANSAGQAPTLVADNALAASDILVFQLDDGTWTLDTVSSGTYSAIVLTTGTPNRNGATIAAGRPVFWFGVNTDSNPATGKVHLLIPPTVSATGDLIGDVTGGGIPALNAGDPLVQYNPNATATTFMSLFGTYGQY